jgi:hypothetical protein
VDSKISFTMDLWTSPNNKAFVSCTAHYIDKEWNFHELLVDFGLMRGKHEGANIAEGFIDVLRKYGLMTKVLYSVLTSVPEQSIN